MMEFVKYKAFIGIDTLFDSSDADDLLNSMSVLIDSVDNGEVIGTFDIVTEYINRTPLYYAVVEIPKWAETVLFIKFAEYDWKEIEGSTI